jgi:two-component system response regulator YesN
MPRKLEVLVVDDESMITDLIENYIRFTSKNTNIHTFNDPLKAREHLRKYLVDVLITDYKMPHLNGIELMEATAQGTKKIMISGYVSEIAEEKLQGLDAVFFEKPVPMKDLGRIIAEEEHRLLLT